MTQIKTSGFRPILWRNNAVNLIDQTRLPSEEVWLEITDYRDIISAIKEMRIRGAPAIGVAGSYGIALAALECIRTTAEGITALNRAFDITPHRYITAIITEQGIAFPPYEQTLKHLIKNGHA